MLCKHPLSSADFYYVGYTSSHSNTEVKQNWAWILLGWETLQGIPGSAGTYPPPPSPLRTEYSLFRLSLSQSSDWDPLKPKKHPLSLSLSSNSACSRHDVSWDETYFYILKSLSFYILGITLHYALMEIGGYWQSTFVGTMCPMHWALSLHHWAGTEQA